jgi:hypothetical protein
MRAERAISSTVVSKKPLRAKSRIAASMILVFTLLFLILILNLLSVQPGH